MSAPHVNWDGSHTTNMFSDNTNPRSLNPNVLPEPVNNIQAAKSEVSCATLNATGGGHRYRKKISRKYKKRMMRSRRSRSRRGGRRHRSGGRKSHRRHCTRRHKHSRRCRRMRGGYSQYQNNMPLTNSFSTGAPLPSNLSALANPPPYHELSRCANCVDNYNHYTNQGFPSRGWH